MHTAALFPVCFLMTVCPLWTMGLSKLAMSIHQNFVSAFWKSQGEKNKITFGFFDIHTLDVCVNTP